MNFSHILNSEKPLEKEGKKNLRNVILARMMANKNENDQIYSDLLDFIRRDVKKRFDLSMQWITQEFANMSVDLTLKRLEERKNNEMVWVPASFSPT